MSPRSPDSPPLSVRPTRARRRAAVLLLALAACATARGAEPPGRLAVYPAEIDVTAGARVRFTAVQYTPDGAARAPARVHWQAGGGEVGRDGVYRAGARPGVYRVQASAGGLRGAARVRILASGLPPVRVEITPALARTRVGRPVRLRARGFDGANRPVGFTPRWRSAGGEISADGVFRAARPGRYTVSASDPSGRAIGTATVVVTPPRWPAQRERGRAP